MGCDRLSKFSDLVLELGDWCSEVQTGDGDFDGTRADCEPRGRSGGGVHEEPSVYA
jgi:hypothetical protein